MNSAPRSTGWVHVLVLSLLCIVLYWNALYNDFVYDDQDQVLRNLAIRGDQPWTRLFTQDVWGFRKIGPGGSSNYYRPLQFLAYRLLYSRFGLNPLAFHAVNLAFHLLATLAAYVLLCRLLGNSSQAFPAGLLFAAHAIHTEAVAWVSALTELLCALFFFLTILFLILAEEADARRCFYFSFSLAFAFLAFLAKEMAFTLPLVLLLYLLIRSGPRIPVRRLVLILVPYLVVFLIYVGLRIHALGALTHLQHHIPLTPYEYVLSVIALVGKYLVKLFLPIRLNAFHVLEPARALLEWKVLASGAALVALAWLFFRLRQRHPAAAFLLAWTLLTLAPVLYIGGVGENVFAERYLYIPSLGFCGFVGMSLSAAGQRPQQIVWHLSWAVLLLVLGFYGWQTVRRNPDWRNNFVLYSDTVKKSPKAALMHNAVAQEYLKRGNRQLALDHYFQALHARQQVFYASRFTAYFALLGIAEVKSQQGQFAEAEKLILQAIAVAPNYPNAYNDYGRLLTQQGRKAEGIRYLEQAVELGPDDEIFQFNLGVAFLDSGAYERARQHLERSLQIYPQDPEAWRLFGIACLHRRRFAEAEAAFQQALNLNPDQKGVHRYLGALYYDTSRYAEAAHAFRRAVELAPDDADAAHWLKLAEGKIAHK